LTRVLWLAAALVSCACSPLEPEDLDVSQRDAVMPEGWVGSTSPDLYSHGVDRATKHGGMRSAFFSGTSSTTESFVQISQAVRADNYRGKRIRWSGWVRTWDIVSEHEFPSGGALWMRVDGYTQTFAFDNMVGTGRGIRGTTSRWEQANIVLDVPSNAVVIHVGALLQGSGDLLIDDLRLETVGADVIPTGGPTPTARDSATVASQYRQARPQPVNLDFEGLPPL
jgi:hypothetical protein